MNIVRLLGRKTVLTTIAAGALSIIAIQFALTPQQISVVCDARWSADVQKIIKTTIEKASLRSDGINQLKQSLLADVPCLKDLVVTYSASLKATVRAVGWKPLVQIQSSLPGNKEYVACEKGNVFEKRYFSGPVLKRLPRVTIVGGDFEETRHLNKFIEMVLHMPPELYEQYTVFWHSETNICVRDKEKRLGITADITSVHEKERYTYVQRIFASEKKYHYGMKADIRYKDSIVCTPVTKSSTL